MDFRYTIYVRIENYMSYGRIFKFLVVVIVFVAGILLFYSYYQREKFMENFVTARGQDLYLKGKVFRSVGVNRYNLLSRDAKNGQIGCANTFSEKQITQMFSQLHSMGVTSVRFWLFQSFTKNGKDLSRLDFVIKTATKYNIKLIPVFENHWKDCTEGGEKSASWYSSGYRKPYGKYVLSLNDYIGKIVPKYKNNTTILSWEIINEADVKDSDALVDFASDVSDSIKSLDPNHLVSISMFINGVSLSEYTEVSNIDTIDVLDYHDYDNDSKPLPDGLNDIIREAKIIHKPLFITESGIKNSVKDRSRLFKAKIDAFFKNGGSVYMIWSYGEPYITDDGYNFGSKDPVAGVVKKTATEIKSD